MKTVTVTVVNQIGLHARPASLLTNLAKKFNCDIEFYKNGDDQKKHQPKSIISIMALGAKKGDELTFIANGPEEENALSEIEAFINSGCGETE